MNELMIMALTVIGSVVSLLLLVIAYFLKKTDNKIDGLANSVIDLNLTISTVISKNKASDSILSELKSEFKDHRLLVWEEIKILRDFRHKHEHDAASVATLLKFNEDKLKEIDIKILKLEDKINAVNS